MTGCYAKGCRNASCHGLKMSFFPRNPERRAQWTENCKKYCATTYRLPNDHSALCEFHFAAEMWEKPRVDGKKKLKLCAVPTIFGDKVPQMYKKGIDSPVKVSSSPQKILRPVNPNTPGYQVVALPMVGNTFKILLPVSQSTPGKMDNFEIQTIKDGNEATSNQSPSRMKGNAGLLLNSNGVSHFIESAPSKVTPTVTFQNGAQRVQQSTEDITSENHSTLKTEKDEGDSDLDSFIANNFEPVSDQEMDVDDNFEPVPDDVIATYEEDDVKDIKEFSIITNPITSEEIQLETLKRELETSDHTNDKKCNRCARTERVFEKSERIRIMMRKKFKQRQREVKKTIQSLEDKIEAMETTKEALSKLFNSDQLSFLLGLKKKVPKWSNSTLQKAHECWLACGTKGYQYLLEQNWPLPSLKSLRKNRKKIFSPYDDKIEYVTHAH